MRRWFLVAFALGLSSACGRVRFQPVDGGMDAFVVDMAMPDAHIDDTNRDVAMLPDVGVDAAFDVGADAWVSIDARQDAGVDAPHDGGSDAGHPDAGVCADMLTNAAAYGDEALLACASHGGIGMCTIFDNTGHAVCPGCACEWYQQSTRPTCAECPNRWMSTGCTDFGGAPTWASECEAAALGRDRAICILRALLATGECAPCTCTGS